MKSKVSHQPEIALFWFRRDLRLEDNLGLLSSLSSDMPVLPIYIFDKNILGGIKNRSDLRVQFIHSSLHKLKQDLANIGGSLLVLYGDPTKVIKSLLSKYNIKTVFANRDYEPYARKRDFSVAAMLVKHQIEFKVIKDQVIFEASEILDANGRPYENFGQYLKQWKAKLKGLNFETVNVGNLAENLINEEESSIPPLDKLGFNEVNFKFPDSQLSDQQREHLNLSLQSGSTNGTSHLGVHLRYGTISIRNVVREALKFSEKWLVELIKREFYTMILYHFPGVVNHPFDRKFEKLKWNEDKKLFQAWCKGKTGYPLIDASMRELKENGFMSFPLRSLCATFLVKDLMINWRLGEKYFAEKLLDFELASNNGNWQKCVGCGPESLIEEKPINPNDWISKLDPDNQYIQKWIPEFGTNKYPSPIVDHESAIKKSYKAIKKVLK